MKQSFITKNFIFLILGQMTSLFGNFILRLALSMYVLEITGSAAIFATILSAATIPTIVLSPLGGILADRADKRTVMVALDALTGGAVLCAALLLSEQNALLVIGMLLMILSAFGAFETPTVQACIPSMLTGDNIIKGNAVVNQAASLSYFIAPMMGGALYAMFGLKPVMFASVGLFFSTAFLECFITLNEIHFQQNANIFSTVKQDFLQSMQYIFKEQTVILKLLSLTALCRFFVMGITVVGLPFMVRTVLGLDASYYGAAESALAVATILGSIAAGLVTGKLKVRELFLVLSFLGICMLPAGIVFLLPIGTLLRYAVTVVCFCGVQVAVSIFSIFAVSLIQERTPKHFIGKIMAYTSTVTLCVQPIGQIVYGFWFDGFSDAVSLILIPSGVIVCIIGLLSADLFTDMEINV